MTDIEWPGDIVAVCACGTEMLYAVDDEGCIDLCLWNHGRWPMTARQRLRNTWQILRHGRPYPDQVSLNKQDVPAFAINLAAAAGVRLVPFTSNGTTFYSFASNGAST